MHLSNYCCSARRQLCFCSLRGPSASNVPGARVTKNETLIRREKKWFRYDAPDKRLFKNLQKALATS